MCEIEIKSKQFKNLDHFANGFSRIYELMLQQKFCDVVLIFDNHKIRAHKIILASCSNYFKELFMTEKEEYVIDSFDLNAVRHVINYCYTGIIDINNTNVNEILSIVSLLQLEPMITECFNFMKENINDENCLNILNQSQLHSATSIENDVMEYIQMRFKKISTTENFLKLELIQLKGILKNDHLNVASENEIFDSVKRWVKYNEEERKEHKMTLMECIRMPFLTTEVLLEEVQQFCDTNLQCNTMITQALGSKLLPNKKNLSNASNKPRSSKNTILIFGTYSGNGIAEIYNPEKNVWSAFVDTKIVRRNFGVVLVNECFIIVGGYNDQGVLNQVESVDVHTGKIVQLSPMQDARAHMAAVCIDEYVYIPGGINQRERSLLPLSTMERFHIKSNKWSYSAPMLTPRQCFDIATIGKEFYVVGGWSINTACNTTEAFCTTTGKWRRCAPMITKRCWPGVTAVNDYLYVIGGREDYDYRSTTYSSLEKYDPKNDVWTIVANLKRPLYAIGAGQFGSKVVAIGGSSVATSLVTDVDEYDPENRTWKSLSPILEKREVTNIFSVPLSWIKQ